MDFAALILNANRKMISIETTGMQQAGSQLCRSALGRQIYTRNLLLYCWDAISSVLLHNQREKRTNYFHFSCHPPPKPPHSYPCTCLSALHCRIRKYCAQSPLCIQPKPGFERCVARAEQLQQIKAPLLPFLPLWGFIPPPQNPRAPSSHHTTL